MRAGWYDCDGGDDALEGMTSGDAYRHELGEANATEGHGFSCAYAAGGDCTCGVSPCDESEEPTAAETFGYLGGADDAPTSRKSFAPFPLADDDTPF